LDSFPAATIQMAMDAKAVLSEAISSVQDTLYLLAKSTTVSNPLTTAEGEGLYLSVAAVVPDSMDNYTITAGPGAAGSSGQEVAAAAGQALLQMPPGYSAAYTGSAELLLPYLQYFADSSLFTATRSGPLVNQPGVLEAYPATGAVRVGMITAQNSPFSTEAPGTLCHSEDYGPVCHVKLLLLTTLELDPALPTQCLQYQPATGTFNLVSAGSAEVILGQEGESWVSCNISKPGFYLAQQSRIATLGSSIQQDATIPANDTSAPANPYLPQFLPSSPPGWVQVSSHSSDGTGKVRGRGTTRK
jgi:hypothetical protein